MRLTHLLLGLSVALACGKDTDTSVSETAATTTGVAATTGDQATSDGTGALTSEITTGLTGGMTGDATGASGTTTGDPTTTDDPSLGTTSLTTDEPETTAATSGATTGEIDDCDELKAVFASEVLEIRSCVALEECGQELKGTSCGCTNNWVARLDADTADFYALIAQAERLRCELFLFGTCDCPAADGFVCQDGICGWNYL